jgi:glycosyltransferase involved in cell wall biosynthesis
MRAPAEVKISIVVPTYNRADALVMVLRALADQQEGDFEVLVADDGSGPETAATIARLAPDLPYALHHVWQPDEGFRLAMIRNRAIATASGDYLLFLDGDCLPLPDYIAQHRRLAAPGWFVTGNRILLSPGLTRRAIERGLAIWQWGRLAWIKARLQGDIHLLVPLLRLRNRSRVRETWIGTEGCNMAAWRSDCLALNGFDESFVGWGYEDSDFAQRLLLSGCRRRATRWNVPVLHLWHQAGGQAGQNTANQALFERAVASGRVRAEHGVDQYLATG